MSTTHNKYYPFSKLKYKIKLVCFILNFSCVLRKKNMKQNINLTSWSPWNFKF